MSKPEATFITSIHRYLKPIEELDAIGMGGTYTNGIADVYYDGPKSDLWVEYKFIERMPKKLDLLKPTTKPTLSALQDHFLKRREDNGHLAWVIVGCQEGGIILGKSIAWRAVVPTQQVQLFNRRALADLICQAVCGYGLNEIK